VENVSPDFGVILVHHLDVVEGVVEGAKRAIGNNMHAVR